MGRIPSRQIGNLDLHISPSFPVTERRKPRQKGNKAARGKKLMSFSNPTLSENRRITRDLIDIQALIDPLERKKNRTPRETSELMALKGRRRALAGGLQKVD